MTSKEKIEKAWELVNSKHIETNDEIQLVRYAVRMARDLADRDTPFKVKPILNWCKCSIRVYPDEKFCKECGQRLDWSALNDK